MKQHSDNQKDFWEEAGRRGYGQAMFSSSLLEQHIMSKHWRAALEAAEALDMQGVSRVLELGCGDGTFAGTVLAARFAQVDAFDNSRTAIQRARSSFAAGNVRYRVADITDCTFADGQTWDGAFLVGFLHHVKGHAEGIVRRLSGVCPRLVVVEPNGDNLVRKALELLPSYRRAGEDSFRLSELLALFDRHGFRQVSLRRVTLVPSFLPSWLLPPLKRVEDVVERHEGLSRLCSTYVLGLERRAGIT